MIGALSRVSLCLSLFAYLVFAAAVVEADEIDVKSDRRFNAVAWTQNAAEYRMLPGGFGCDLR